jgi:transcriptional regulator with XRE-family HTH domain
MSDFGGELARLMTDRGIGVRQLARALYVNPGHVSNLRSGKARPSRELAAAIDEHLDAGGALAALAPAAGSQTAAAPGDEIAALELARRAAASDVGDGTCGPPSTSPARAVTPRSPRGCSKLGRGWRSPQGTSAPPSRWPRAASS